MAVFYNARQDDTIQNSTIQYNNTHVALKATLYTQKLQKNQERILYTIKTHKWVETKVDESVLQITMYTKQSINHTIQ